MYIRGLIPRNWRDSPDWVWAMSFVECQYGGHLINSESPCYLEASPKVLAQPDLRRCRASGDAGLQIFFKIGGPK